jgi:DNA invertase Pin-like site-specific DNA recombinase
MSSKAAIYLRQSVDAKAGIMRQRTRTRALAKARGWRVVAEYEDNDVSASKLRGPATGWGQMLGALDRHEFEVVIAVDLDRLLRSTRDLNTLIDKGAKVVTVDGEIDLATADGEFRATMLAGIARFEGRRKSERQRRANLQRVERGKRTGNSRRQFGFAKDGLTMIEPEAEAIRDGYAALLDAVPLAAIARDWNGRGLVTTQARQARSGHAGEPSPWTSHSVRVVLMNPRNAGIVTYQGAEVAVDATGSPVKAEWEPITKVDTFRSAVQMLNDPARRTSGASGKYLLTGLAKCGVEGCGAGAHAGGAARPGVRAYRCGGSTGHFARKADPVDEFVTAVVLERLARPDARSLLMQPGEDTRALRREALVVERRVEEVAGLVADGTFTPAQARSAVEKLRVKRDDLNARISDAGRVNVLGALVGASDVREAWEALDVNRQRAVIDVLMTVTLHPVGRGTRTFRPETVAIGWKTA